MDQEIIENKKIALDEKVKLLKAIELFQNKVQKVLEIDGSYRLRQANSHATYIKKCLEQDILK